MTNNKTNEEKKGDVIPIGEDMEVYLVWGVSDIDKGLNIFHKYYIREFEDVTIEELEDVISITNEKVVTYYGVDDYGEEQLFFNWGKKWNEGTNCILVRL